MVMERTEWPSRMYLAELREQGIVAYSRFCTCCFSALAVYLALNGQFAEWRNLLELYAKSLESGAAAKTSLAWEDVKVLIGKSFWTLLAPVAAMVVSTLIVGLLQTRFFFRPGQVALNLARLNPVRPAIISRALCEIGQVLSLGWLILVVAVLLTWYYAPLVLSCLNGDVSALVSLPRRVFEAGLLVLIPALTGLACLAWSANQLLFRHRHRMTRAEVMAEAREQ